MPQLRPSTTRKKQTNKQKKQWGLQGAGVWEEEPGGWMVSRLLYLQVLQTSLQFRLPN